VLRNGKHLSFRQPFRVRPIFIIWFAQNSGDFLELIHFTAARKQGFKRIQLSHYTAKSKDIYRVVVTSTSKHIFWGSVPPCRNILCERCGVTNFFNKTEIPKFYDSLVLDKDIFGLDVSVEKAVIVDII
jgi:hypothetical protein